MSCLAEKPVEELLRKYLGLSMPRMALGVLMLIFGILILVFPAVLWILVGLYLIISGVLVIVDEYTRSQKAKGTSSS